MTNFEKSYDCCQVHFLNVIFQKKKNLNLKVGNKIHFYSSDWKRKHFKIEFHPNKIFYSILNLFSKILKLQYIL